LPNFKLLQITPNFRSVLVTVIPLLMSIGGIKPNLKFCLQAFGQWAQPTQLHQLYMACLIGSDYLKVK
jgi:hypothetical protein